MNLLVKKLGYYRYWVGYTQNSYWREDLLAIGILPHTGYGAMTWLFGIPNE